MTRAHSFSLGGIRYLKLWPEPSRPARQKIYTFFYPGLRTCLRFVRPIIWHFHNGLIVIPTPTAFTSVGRDIRADLSPEKYQISRTTHNPSIHPSSTVSPPSTSTPQPEKTHSSTQSKPPENPSPSPSKHMYLRSPIPLTETHPIQKSPPTTNHSFASATLSLRYLISHCLPKRDQVSRGSCAMMW